MRQLLSPEIYFNFGHMAQGGLGDPNYYLSRWKGQLQQLKNLGVKGLRIAMDSSDYQTGVDSTFEIAKMAKRMGFYTQWGVGFNFGGNELAWSQHIEKVKLAAARAWNNGDPLIDLFSIGNEEDATWGYNNITNKVQKLLALAALIKPTYWNGPMTHNDSDGNWFTLGKGGLLPSLNLYYSNRYIQVFINQLAAYHNAFPDMHMTEISLDNENGSYPGDPLTQAREFRWKMEWVLERYPGITLWLFTYNWNGFSFVDIDGYYKPIINGIFKRSRPITRSFADVRESYTQ